MKNYCTIDFETGSPVDLKKRGLYRYARHPDTHIKCLSVAWEEDDPVIWAAPMCDLPGLNLKYKQVDLNTIIDMVQCAEMVVAQNAAFEYQHWREIMSPQFNCPPLPLSKLYDTQAQLAYHALPLHLEAGGAALNLIQQKDKEGHQVMMRMSKPRKPRKVERDIDPLWSYKLFWHNDKRDIEKLFDYCCQDVISEREIFLYLPQIPPRERAIWMLDQIVNMRGIHVDVQNIQSIVDTLETYEFDQLKRFKRLTRGEVSSPKSYVKLRDWINREADLNLKSVDKQTISYLQRMDLPDLVREIVSIKAALAKSSVAKFKAMLEMAEDDDRVRGTTQYHGASTGRWAGRGIQPHNFPRKSYDEETWDWLSDLWEKKDYRAIEVLQDNPMEAASKSLRGAICAAPGCELTTADYSAIEGVGLAYLANEEWVLDAYRQKIELYKINASQIFGVPYDQVNDYQRQVGKVCELALGYAGGIGAFFSMAGGYGVNLEELAKIILAAVTEQEMETARRIASMYQKTNPGNMSFEQAVACDIVKQRWRNGRPNTVRFWRQVEEAAKGVTEKRAYQKLGDMTFSSDGQFLRIMLPAGRALHYYHPALRPLETPWGQTEALTYMALATVGQTTTQKWTRIHTYSGKLVENIVQGFCRDILAEAMLNLHTLGYDITMHVHDEIVVEAPIGKVDLDKFNKIMSKVPPWAPNMPITVKGWQGRRYRKD